MDYEKKNRHDERQRQRLCLEDMALAVRVASSW